MAVVFISPKQRQKVFFMGITIVLLMFLVITFLAVFLSAPKEVSEQMVFNKPKVSIDLKTFDSTQFKGLNPFVKMDMQGVQAGRDNPFTPYYLQPVKKR